MMLDLLDYFILKRTITDRDAANSRPAPFSGFDTKVHWTLFHFQNKIFHKQPATLTLSGEEEREVTAPLFATFNEWRIKRSSASSTLNQNQASGSMFVQLAQLLLIPKCYRTECRWRAKFSICVRKWLPAKRRCILCLGQPSSASDISGATENNSKKRRN